MYSNFIKKTAFLLLLAFLLSGCGNSSDSTSDRPFANCQYGAPKAIFNAQISKVQEHTFQLNAQAAIEKVKFEGGVALELIQSGCERPKQEFQFTIPTSTNSFKDEDWLMMGVDLLGFMGSIDPALQPLLLWKAALEVEINQLKIGLPHQLEPGFFVKMDKVAAMDAGLLILTLYQE